MLDAILNGLFPANCSLCGLPSAGSLPLCRPCQRQLLPNRFCCSACALPLPNVNFALPQARQVLCGKCQAHRPPYMQAVVPWIYDEQMALLMQRWKFAGEQRFTPLLAHLWLSAVPSPPEVDLLIPVPLHWRKLWQRGFNQATQLATELQARNRSLAAVELVTRGISRNRATSAQSAMGARARQSNLRAAFTVDVQCENLRVAIIDDVLTTGATATALTEALLAAGAAQVQIWCLARTPAPDNGANSAASGYSATAD